MRDIHAIILDIDGVIIGERVGHNSPYPHPDVTSALKTVRESGIPIILCTAKPGFAIRKIVEDADLDNFHITDGGGVVIDILKEKILKSHIIPAHVVKQVIQTLIDNDIYTEVYTTN
jgi:hydroxymethylpyrimidine pyrophosphatase-like HAD family hydrolase